MKKLALAIVTSTALFATGANAIGTGFYAGVAGGAGALDAEHKYSTSNTNKGTKQTSKSHFGRFSGNLGLFAGYGFVNCGSYYIGTELGAFLENSEGVLESDKFSDTQKGVSHSSKSKFKRKGFGTFAVRAGYLVSKNVMLYARLGAELARWKGTDTSTDTAGLVTRTSLKSKNKVSFAPGFGIEADLTDKVTIRGEYVYQINNKLSAKKTINLPAGVKVSDTTRPHHHRTTIGIAYRF